MKPWVSTHNAIVASFDMYLLTPFGP